MFIRMTPFPLLLLDCGPVEMMTIHRLLRTREGPFCGRALIQPSPWRKSGPGRQNNPPRPGKAPPPAPKKS